MENNNIDHPSHYCNGGMECIDEMLTVFGREAVKHIIDEYADKPIVE